MRVGSVNKYRYRNVRRKVLPDRGRGRASRDIFVECPSGPMFCGVTGRNGGEGFFWTPKETIWN